MSSHVAAREDATCSCGLLQSTPRSRFGAKGVGPNILNLGTVDGNERYLHIPATLTPVPIQYEASSTRVRSGLRGEFAANMGNWNASRLTRRTLVVHTKSVQRGQCCSLTSYGLWRRAVGWVTTDLSNNKMTISRVKQSKILHWLLDPENERSLLHSLWNTNP